MQQQVLILTVFCFRIWSFHSAKHVRWPGPNLCPDWNSTPQGFARFQLYPEVVGWKHSIFLCVVSEVVGYKLQPLPSICCKMNTKLDDEHAKNKIIENSYLRSFSIRSEKPVARHNSGTNEMNSDCPALRSRADAFEINKGWPPSRICKLYFLE